MTIRQLAHELNSLLDGATRCMRQVQRGLSEAPDPARNDVKHAEQMAKKLQLADSSMQQMVVLLERAMSADEPDCRVLTNDRPLGEYVPDLITTLRPKANEYGVVVNLHMTNDAASVQTGSLGTVLLNGLTNAIDACASSENMPRIIEVSISISSRSDLVILISDTGPGVIETCRTDDASGRTTKSGGHGIGLDLCRQIINDLDGRLQLTNIPFGAGAIFQVRVPLPRLRAA